MSWREALQGEARKKKPLLKRLFLKGTFFNYEAKPLQNRVTKCKENVSLAGMKILAEAERIIRQEPLPTPEQLQNLLTNLAKSQSNDSES